MVYVRIELWPGGDRTKARLLQEVEIANVGGNPEIGEYGARLSHSSTFRGDGTIGAGVWKSRTGGISHDRRKSPAHLVRAALERLLR